MTALNFTTLPPEIRSAIYSHIFNQVHIITGREAYLNTESFPYQITAVSRLIRTETLPLLLKSITLFCQSGYFPDRTRRRLPNRILANITKIVILDDLAVDEIKPTLRSFPKLKTFELDVVSYQGFRKFGLLNYRSGLDPVKMFRECVLSVIIDHDVEMSMPREGLERDYLPEDTLYRILMYNKARGFDIIARRRAWHDGDDERRDAIITEMKLEHQVFQVE